MSWCLGWTPCPCYSPARWPPPRWGRRSSSCRRWGGAERCERPACPRDSWTRWPESSVCLCQTETWHHCSAVSSSSSSSSLPRQPAGRSPSCPSPGPRHRSPPPLSSGDPRGTWWGSPHLSGRSRTRRTRMAARWGRHHSGGDSVHHLERERLIIHNNIALTYTVITTQLFSWTPSARSHARHSSIEAVILVKSTLGFYNYVKTWPSERRGRGDTSGQSC